MTEDQEDSVQFRETAPLAIDHLISISLNRLWTENQPIAVMWSGLPIGLGRIRLLVGGEIVCETPSIIGWANFFPSINIVMDNLKEWGKNVDYSLI